MELRIPNGTVIQGYTFLEKIGEGGSSTIYKVHSSKFDVLFAAKVLHLDPSESPGTRLTADAEIDTLMHLNHPNIILLYEHFFHEGAEIIILEYCSNGNLKDEIRHTDGFDLDRFADVARKLLGALEFCHSKGIYHRDIKPGNVLIDQYNRPKLADFGIASRACDGDWVGTPGYMAPEILAKRATDMSKVDIWALGITFGHMIEGRLPWPTISGTTTEAIIRGHYVISRRVPRSLLDVLKHMLMLNPVDRWSAQQLLAHPYFAEQVKPKGIASAVTLPFAAMRKDSTVRPGGVKLRAVKNRPSMNGSCSVVGLTFGPCTGRSKGRGVQGRSILELDDLLEAL